MFAANCSVVPDSTPSDAGIAGPGVLLSFIITAGVSMALSASLILQETLTARRRAAARSEKSAAHHFAPLSILPRSTSSMSGLSGLEAVPSISSTIRRKLLNSYSDQQIMTGIGIQSVGLAQATKLVPYHFFLIWMLGLLSTAVHNAALLALVHDFRRDWVLRWLRQALMLVNLALSCVYGAFVLRGLTRGLAPTLPVACVWDSRAALQSGSGSVSPFQYVATAAAIAGNCAVFLLATWYLHSRRQRFYRIVQATGLLLMTAVAIGATVRVLLLSQAFGRPSVTLSYRGETQWSFGQLLSLLLLLLPLISTIEIARGEVEVAAPVLDADEDGLSDSAERDTAPLVHSGQSAKQQGSTRSSFQPNPFFGR